MLVVRMEVGDVGGENESLERLVMIRKVEDVGYEKRGWRG